MCACRQCCCTFEGEEYEDAYCRGSALNTSQPCDHTLNLSPSPSSPSQPPTTTTNIGDTPVEHGTAAQRRGRRRLGESVYTGLVVQLVLEIGQRLTILPGGDGLM